MQDPNLPLIRDLVLIGGGHTHTLVARMWAMKPLAGVRLTLINPDPVAPYTGMLPGLIAGHYQRADIMIDLVRLARFAGARLILDRAIGIDRDAQTVILQGRAPLPYDLASLDIGITSDLPDLVGFADFTRSAKPLGDYARAWEAFVAMALPQPRVVVIGGGIGGVELALASAMKLPSLLMDMLPFAVLLGTLSVFNQLNRSHEVVALRAAGLPARRVAVGPMLVVVLVGALALTLLNPLADARQKLTADALAKLNPASGTAETFQQETLILRGSYSRMCFAASLESE